MTHMVILTFPQDRGAIGNARIMGFQKDLHLSNDQFFNCLMMFCKLSARCYVAPTNTLVRPDVGYMVFELPAALSLRIIHPPYVYGTAVISFGICAACMSTAMSYAAVMVLRLLIGLAEAFVQTGFVFISLWYTKDELTTRCGTI